MYVYGNDFQQRQMFLISLREKKFSVAGYITQMLFMLSSEEFILKKRFQKILPFLFALSLGCNILALFMADKLIHYRQFIRHIDTSFPNEGLRLVASGDIRAAGLPNTGVFIGGNLPRYWFFPKDFSHHIVNKSGVEESISLTRQRFHDTVIRAGADFVLINAGFCNIVTAVRQGKDPSPMVQGNFEVIQDTVALAQTNSILPILSSLPPVRPRFLLPHTQKIEYSSKFKKEENAAIEQFNNLLRDYCREKQLAFIDFHKVLSDENRELIQKYAVTDGEHLNLAGYTFLTSFLEKELDSIFRKSYNH